MKAQDDAGLRVPLFVSDSLLVVCRANEREHRAIHAGARLDHMRDESLLRLLVEIIERLPAGVLVLGEVVVRPISHALELLDAEWELEFNVVSPL